MTQEKKKKRISMLRQVARLFAVGVIIIGVLTFYVMYRASLKNDKKQLMDRAEATSEDLHGFMSHYPAHEWLYDYWYEHADELEVDYDATYDSHSITAKKAKLMDYRHPQFLL